MSPRTSAGLLPVRLTGTGLEVFIGHLGGPFWARKDERAWSILKGEYDASIEDPWAAAQREWIEETGAPVPPGERHDLGTVTQSGGKQVHAYAILTQADIVLVQCNTVTMEWPPRSGREVTFPEIDRAEWCTLGVAAQRLVSAQAGFLGRLPMPR